MAGPAVLIVEDDPRVQQYLQQLVRQLYPGASIVTADSIRLACAQVANIPYTLALVDIGLPDGNGIEVISHLHAKSPETAIVVMSSISHPLQVLSAIDAGAIGYLVKNGNDADILAALRSVQRGGSPIDPLVARCILDRVKQRTQPVSETIVPIKPGAVDLGDRCVRITQRELQVLQQLSSGLSNQALADKMCLSRTTVESHIRSIYRKLCVHSRMQAVLAARARGLCA